MHAVIDLAREGLLPGVGRSFEKIVYVGHSYGSLVGNHLAVNHPFDVDAYILSGFSLKLAQGVAGVLVLPAFLPAAAVSPTRFGGSDPGYLMASSQSGFRTVFYHGDYAEEVFQYDYSRRQTVTVSEVLTALLGQSPVPEYGGDVFVLNGNEDGIFCEDGPVQALAGVRGDCGKGYSSGAKDAYPKARRFGWYNTAETGHLLNNHRTARESFEAAHEFLATSGF
jgi:pimeloyl-ACP methyl ester carboxylesterase